jgi:hypothetical protein
MRRRDRVGGVVGPGAKPCEGWACHPADYKPRFRFEQDNVGNSGILSAADRHKSRRGLERRSPFRAPRIANSAEVEDRVGARRSRVNPPWTSRARGRTSVAIPLQPRRSQLPPLSKTVSARAGIASKNAAVRKTRPQVEARAPPSGRQAASGPVSRDLIARDPVVQMTGWRSPRPPRRSSIAPRRRIVSSSSHLATSWIPIGSFSELKA